VYIFAGAALSSMCALVLIVTALRGAGYLQQVVNLEHYHIMGKLMLSFVIFWAYIGFSQYMLIWYSNIPEETVYFLRRNTASWWYLSQFMVVGHFFVPFVLLLFQRAKKTPTFLCGMAVWILLMHMLDIYIVVLPALHVAGVRPNPLDFFSLVAIGCTLAAVFLKRLGDSSLFPTRDPRLGKSIALKN
jgi:magnesium-transporting ATPase (P-type)